MNTPNKKPIKEHFTSNYKSTIILIDYDGFLFYYFQVYLPI
jgi:hypothetical protein